MNEHINVLEFTEEERKLIEHSADLEETRSRIKRVKLFGGVSLFFLSYVAFVMKSLPVVAAVSLVYMFITIFEKVAYGNGVLEYKQLIQKLVARLNMADA